jgi:hypothetical protein
MGLSNISNICSNALANPVVGTPIDRRIFVSPYNNAIGDNRFINPITGDYQFNASGKTAGLFGVQQQVYLCLTTALGSSASVNLGETYGTIQVIANNYTQDLNNAIGLALSPLIAAGQIVLNGIIVQRPNSGTSVVVLVNWTDLTVTSSQLTNQNYGPNQVRVPPNIFNCSATQGIDPASIPSLEADYRADRGIIAPFGKVSAWWNEDAFAESGIAFDLNRNAIQPTVALQPQFNASDANLNFQPSITFGTNQWLQTEMWTDGYLQDPMTIFVVGYWKDNASTYVAFDGYNGQQYQFLNASGTLEIKETTTATGGAATLTPNVYMIVFNDGYSVYRQSSNTSISFTGTPGSNKALGFTIGNSLAGNQGGMTIAEIAIFSGVLNNCYQDSLMQYFGNRYKITIT